MMPFRLIRSSAIQLVGMGKIWQGVLRSYVVLGWVGLPLAAAWRWVLGALGLGLEVGWWVLGALPGQAGSNLQWCRAFGTVLALIASEVC